MVPLTGVEPALSQIKSLLFFQLNYSGLFVLFMTFLTFSFHSIFLPF